jgi:hypothetical protein
MLQKSNNSGTQKKPLNTPVHPEPIDQFKICLSMGERAAYQPT